MVFISHGARFVLCRRIESRERCSFATGTVGAGEVLKVRIWGRLIGPHGGIREVL